MSAAASILIYGRDLDLLETRCWVLQRAGYRIYLASELSKLKDVAAKQPIDMLLLCHSLPPEDCEEALAATESLRSGVKRLLVTANTTVAPSLANEATVSAFAGPRAMLAAVRTMLSTEDDPGHKAN